MSLQISFICFLNINQGVNIFQYCLLEQNEQCDSWLLSINHYVKKLKYTVPCGDPYEYKPQHYGYSIKKT